MVYANFARALERENAELREQLKHSDVCLEAMTKAEHEEVNANAILIARVAELEKAKGGATGGYGNAGSAGRESAMKIKYGP